MSKIGRNSPCPCGSGRKYKKCCIGKAPEKSADKEIAAGKAVASSDAIKYLNRSVLDRYQDISAENIITSDFEKDPTFDKLWKEILDGKKRLAFTRIKGSRIQSGFTKHGKDGSKEVVESPPIDPVTVNLVIDDLRRGFRHPVYLYRQHEEGRPEFVCTDDLVLLAAYRKIGISAIPAAVMDPTKSDLDETALLYRYISQKQRVFEECWNPYDNEKKGIPLLSGITAAEIEADQLDMIVGRLGTVLQPLIQKLRYFNSISEKKYHYHHTMASGLAQAARCCKTVEILIKEGFSEQALPIARSLYELALSRYLDWLAPEELGTFFSAAAYMEKKEFRAVVEAQSKESRKAGKTQKQVAEEKKGKNRLYEVVSKVSRRAEVSPFQSLHRGFYKELSSQVHQDLTSIRFFAEMLQSGEDPLTFAYEHRDEDTKLALYVLYLAVSLIYYCGDTDVGKDEGDIF